MGYAVARAAVARGDTVTLVSGPVAIEAPEGCEVVRVRSARQMYDACLARFERSDVVIMAAAVADFRPRSPSAAKIGKADAGRAGGFALELERTEDVLAEMGRRRSGQVLVGFALEAPGGGGGEITDDMRARARAKLEEKGLDAIVLNGPRALGSDESAVEIVTAAGARRDRGTATKDEHARRIIEFASGLALGR
jgi:phosphopantothenoylcysteine decarboxylase/phosphopantothenate--cysteine ligase